MTALPEGFVLHDSGICPVPLDQVADVLVRGFSEPCIVSDFERYGVIWVWSIYNSPLDALAYRPTQQEPR